jgi:hypothetical protein
LAAGAADSGAAPVVGCRQQPNEISSLQGSGAMLMERQIVWLPFLFLNEPSVIK